MTMYQSLLMVLRSLPFCKWVYFARTIPDISDLLKPLENAIRTCFLTSLTGQNALSDDMRTLLSLPVRLGGLGIINPSLTSDYHFSSSVMITDPLVSLIRLQSFTYPVTAMTEILQRKVHVRNGRKTVLSNMAQELPSSSCASKTKQSKRQVSKETFHKWQRTYEREHQSLTWLRAEMDDQEKSLVSTLWCAVCGQYETRICGLKNFSRARISGSSNHKTSNITDHANSELFLM